eukprot:525342-Pleurochrysis_carterae.AAC.1
MLQDSPVGQYLRRSNNSIGALQAAPRACADAAMPCSLHLPFGIASFTHCRTSSAISTRTAFAESPSPFRNA